MYSLHFPQRNDWADFTGICTRRSARIRPVLESIAPQVEVAYSTYSEQHQRAYRASNLRLTDGQQQALKSNFGLLDARRPFSSMRDELLGSARNGRCPLCGQRSVATLDHYLPKSTYPEFSVLSRNLVPCCPQCNLIKGDQVGDLNGRRFLHPYYDQLPDTEILVADVVIETTVTVTYRVTHAPGATKRLVDNIEYHFHELRLAEYYQTEANQELFDRIGVFHGIYSDGGGRSALEDALRREADSVKAERGLNNWKVALYNGLSRSADFCNGGFAVLVQQSESHRWP